MPWRLNDRVNIYRCVLDQVVAFKEWSIEAPFRPAPFNFVFFVLTAIWRIPGIFNGWVSPGSKSHGQNSTNHAFRPTNQPWRGIRRTTRRRCRLRAGQACCHFGRHARALLTRARSCPVCGGRGLCFLHTHIFLEIFASWE